MRSVQQTSDGGYILAGYSNSTTNGNKTSPSFGLWDGWVIRLDAQGNERWQKSFGGASDDFLEVVYHAREGGYLLGGSSASGIEGTKTSPNYGGSDVWIIRLDADGNELWQQTFGGTGGDQVFCVDQTSDGGWILGGSSTSTNGNKTSPNWGDHDFWAVRLDSAGVKLWDQSCGGSLRDIAKHTRQTPDGGFLIGGHTLSGADGTKTSPPVGGVRDDFWVVRLDGQGRQLWDKEYLVPPRWPNWHPDRQELESFDLTPDGGFLLGGPAEFFVPTQFNKSEFGIVRIDAIGNELWSRCLAYDARAYPGGAHGDFLYSVHTLADTGFLLGGRSGSVDYQFAWDFWLVRVDENGDRLWDALYGGSQHEEMRSVRQTSDSGFIIGGYSTSEPGRNKTAPFYGGRDFWVLKLGPESPRLKPLQVAEAQFRFALFPGTTNRAYRIDHSTNLIDWMPFTTNYPRTYKVEITATKQSPSFYRVERLP